jgi:ABC-type nitrate/sulfonate/bicarbonate transport system substrate-binding protein
VRISRNGVLVALCAAALITGLSVVVAACSGSTTSVESSPAQADKVTLQLNWFHEAEFVGYYVADAKGFYGAKGLKVNILAGGPGDPAIGHVIDKTADFAISSFGEQRDVVAEKGPTVAVMSAFQIPPLVIFSLTESGIKEPANLVGRRVGVTTDYWKGILEDTLKAAGVDPARVTAVKVKAEDLQALYNHGVDAWLGYAQDEPIEAETSGHDVTTIFPADYGVGGYEGLVLVNESTIKDDPDVVRKFVQASQQGWRYAVEHPDEAAQILLKWAPEPGLEFQKLAVRAVGPLVDTPQAPVGWIDATRWQQLMGSTYDAAHPGYTMDFASER